MKTAAEKKDQNTSSLSGNPFSFGNVFVNFFTKENTADKILLECINQIDLVQLNDEKIQVKFQISNSTYYLDEVDMHECMPYLHTVENLVYFFKSRGFIDATDSVNMTMGSHVEKMFHDYKPVYGSVSKNLDISESVCEGVYLETDCIVFVFLGENMLPHLSDSLKENFPSLVKENHKKCGY